VGKNTLNIKLIKSKQKGAKRPKQEEWNSCSQANKEPVKGMELCRRL
jgi:hypothetical protein